MPATSSDGFFFGGAADAAGTKPIFTDTDATLAPAALLPTSFEILLRGDASIATLEQGVGGFDLSWGTWNSDAAAAAVRFRDASDSASTEGALGNILFASANPVDINAIGTSGRFAVSESLIGGQFAGQESKVRGSFLLDLANATINDFRVQICVGSSTCADASRIWRSELVESIPLAGSGSFIAGTGIDGGVRAPMQDLNTFFDGYFRGMFVGDANGNPGFAAGFRWLENGSKLSGNKEIVDAALLFTLSSDPVSGLSTAELNQVSRNGIVAGGDLTLKTGGTTDFSSALQMFVIAEGSSSFPLTEKDDFSFLRFNNVAPTELVTGVGGFDVQWGVWEDSSGQNLQVRESYYGIGDVVTDMINDPVIGVSLTETPFGSFSGQKQFSDIADHLIVATGFDDNTVSSVTGSLTVDLANGDVTNGRIDVCLGSGACDSNNYGVNFWPVFFSGAFLGTGQKGSAFSNGFTGGDNSVIFADSVGYIVGEQAEGFVLTFSSTRGIGSSEQEALDNARNSGDRFVNGAVLFTGVAGSVSPLTVTESSVETHDIDWGDWDNPVEQNWVTVAIDDKGQASIQTADYIAQVNPTPVANLQGTASYSSGAASAFIGKGSAGAVTDLVAAMDVDFNSGEISNGNLQLEVAGSQVWSVGFDGSVAAGLVDLGLTGGQLSQLGVVVSESITGDLDGVFTGSQGEAFVGAFDLLDEVNAVNQVNGIYTIER